MKVAHFIAPRKLEIVDLPPPKLTEPDHVLLRIDRVGVCGSDVHYYVNGRIGQQVLTYPATLGHECAGTVMEVGAEVAAVQPGDRVAVDPAMACGTCDQCRIGRVNTCRHIQFMGGPGEALGAVAELRVVPAENCLPIPDRMTLDEAALVEPLSIGLHAVRLGQVTPASRIAILGAGPIGLSVLLCAKAAAACTVYMTDLLNERLEIARQCGANWIGNAAQTDLTAIILDKQPQGLDLVFECSGDPRCIDQAQELLAPGGMLVLVGIPPGEQVSFDIHRMRRKELTFKNVRRQRGCMAPIIQMMAEGRIDPRPMLTHRFPLEKISDAFELVAAYRDGVIKAVIEMTSNP
jgi:L-iditol 2-dehydrogenase